MKLTMNIKFVNTCWPELNWLSIVCIAQLVDCQDDVLPLPPPSLFLAQFEHKQRTVSHHDGNSWRLMRWMQMYRMGEVDKHTRAHTHTHTNGRMGEAERERERVLWIISIFYPSLNNINNHKKSINILLGHRSTPHPSIFVYFPPSFLCSVFIRQALRIFSHTHTHTMVNAERITWRNQAPTHKTWKQV